MKAAPDRFAKSAARKVSLEAASSKDVIIQGSSETGQPIRPLRANVGRGRHHDALTALPTLQPQAREPGTRPVPPAPGPTMAKTADAPASFEAALAELEQIVATMEGGALPLKESLAAYRRGAELIQFCQAALKDAEQQVQVLEKGVLKAFDADAGAEAAGGGES